MAYATTEKQLADLERQYWQAIKDNFPFVQIGARSCNNTFFKPGATVTRPR